MDTFLLVAHLCGVGLLFLMISIELVALCGAPRAASTDRLRGALYAGPAAAKLAPVAVLVIAVTGLWMVGRFSWLDFSEPWVVVSIAATVVVSALGVAVHGRRLEALGDAAERAADGPVSAELRALTRDPVMHASGWASVGASVSFLYVMVAHPGAGWSVLAFVIAPAVGVAVGQVLLARSAQQPGPATELPAT